jgi:WhiB family redox-sensing transcriptional regulator
VVITAMSADWAERAACRDPKVDPELFFPVSESGPAARQVAAAKAICARCPVAAQCRDWALQVGEPAGIWGGMTPDERRQLRLARSRPVLTSR